MTEPTWTDVGSMSDLRRDGPFEFVRGDAIVAILLEGDRVFAIDAVCAHQGGPIARGFVSDGCVTCPWHGWQYDLSNGCNTVTGKAMLQTYPARVIKDRIEIEI